MRLKKITWIIACLICVTWTIVVFAGSSAPGDPTDKPRYLGELIHETGFYQSIRLSNPEPLVRKQSKYQLIEVYRSDHFGKILVLDGILQLTELDADAYNEMMAHVPMFQHPNPKRILVIGGGDGYVVSEVLKHDSVEHVDHVDLDQDVIAVCKEHFSWSAAWNDPRVHLHIADGAAFVQTVSPNSYDVVIQDSSDPWTWNDNFEVVELPAFVLYTKEHWANIYRVLEPDGMFIIQADMLQIPADLEDIVLYRKTVLEVGFLDARYGSLMVSTYPTGQTGFLLCEKSLPVKVSYPRIEERFARIIGEGKSTTYYHPRLQNSSFDLPRWAEQRIYGEDGYINRVCRVNDKDSTSTS